MGPYVFVFGTTATDNSGNIVGIGDPYTVYSDYKKHSKSLLAVAVYASLIDVVRTRVYVTDIII
jgi:hypothetical protein